MKHPGTKLKNIDYFIVKCIASWKKDGYCDDVNNHAGCEFDGGDCCLKPVKTNYCKKCECLQNTSGGGGGSQGECTVNIHRYPLGNCMGALSQHSGTPCTLFSR